MGQDVKHIEEYDGNYANLLKNAPHVAAFNINDYTFPKMNLTIVYNDTMQHSLPILLNVLLNTYYRYVCYSSFTEEKKEERKNEQRQTKLR